jgi:general secretion pathway protein I
VSRQRGFTLFEVLVALAIMAIALAALLRATGLAADNSEGLRLKMLATWEAQNQLALMVARREWPAQGTAAGEVKQGGVLLRWERDVIETPDPSLRRVLMWVKRGDNPYVLAELNGFIRLTGGGG